MQQNNQKLLKIENIYCFHDKKKAKGGDSWVVLGM